MISDHIWYSLATGTPCTPQGSAVKQQNTWENYIINDN